jgi:hypothetical protein
VLEIGSICRSPLTNEFMFYGGAMTGEALRHEGWLNEAQVLDDAKRGKSGAKIIGSSLARALRFRSQALCVFCIDPLAFPSHLKLSSALFFTCFSAHVNPITTSQYSLRAVSLSQSSFPAVCYRLLSRLVNCSESLSFYAKSKRNRED